jgi:hypothetical protein
VLSESRKGLLAVGSGVHLITVLSKSIADYAADTRVVIDDKDAPHISGHLCAACVPHLYGTPDEATL